MIMSKLKKLGGTGGVITLDRMGNVAMPFNTEGMHRGYISGFTDEQPVVAIYRDDQQFRSEPK